MPLRVEAFDDKVRKWVTANVIRGEDGVYSLPNISESGGREIYIFGSYADDSASYLRRVIPQSEDITPFSRTRTLHIVEEEIVTVAELNTGEDFELSVKPEEGVPLIQIRFSHI